MQMNPTKKMKILPVLAVAISLSPFAAQAQTAHQSAQAQAYHHADEVMVGSSTIDSASNICSNDVFPDSFGG